MFSLFSSTAYAQTATKAAEGPGIMDMIIFVLGFMSIYFFFMNRSQGKNAKSRTSLFDNLKNGDEVITTSGIIGRVKSIADDFITLEIAHNTSIKIVKSHISGLTEQQAAKVVAATSK